MTTLRTGFVEVPVILSESRLSGSGPLVASPGADADVLDEHVGSDDLDAGAADHDAG